MNICHEWYLLGTISKRLTCSLKVSLKITVPFMYTIHFSECKSKTFCVGFQRVHGLLWFCITGTATWTFDASLLLVWTNCWTNTGLTSNSRCHDGHLTSQYLLMLLRRYSSRQSFNTCFYTDGTWGFTSQLEILVLDMLNISLDIRNVFSLAAISKHHGKGGWGDIHSQQNYNLLVVYNPITRLILGLCSANERWRYFVTPSLIGWAQA